MLPQATSFYWFTTRALEAQFMCTPRTTHTALMLTLVIKWIHNSNENNTYLPWHHTMIRCMPLVQPRGIETSTATCKLTCAFYANASKKDRWYPWPTSNLDWTRPRPVVKLYHQSHIVVFLGSTLVHRSCNAYFSLRGPRSHRGQYSANPYKERIYTSAAAPMTHAKLIILSSMNSITRMVLN